MDALDPEQTDGRRLRLARCPTTSVRLTLTLTLTLELDDATLDGLRAVQGGT